MEIKIIPYREEHHAIFRQLNLEWLDHYNLTESHDLMILDDPEGTVLKEGEYELVKMGVTESHRGKGISKLLIEQCLAKAKEIGAKKLALYSNHQLQTAIGLYEKYGFYHVELVNSPLETADIRMELML